jgi:hypothetical protein
LETTFRNLLRLENAITRTMKLITTLILTVISLTVFSQETNSGIKTIEKELVTTNELLILVAKIPVSETTTAHTYKFNSTQVGSQNSNDSEQNGEYSVEIKNITELLLGVSGVFECSFDNATQTFTILSGPTTDLSQVIERINKN